MNKNLPSLDRKIPIPLYYQLKTNLLNAIHEGIYQSGENIPTEAELVNMLGISRSTVRQAIAELVQEGILERRANKGTFVCKPQDRVTFIRSFEPFYQQVSQTGKQPRTELLNLNLVEANAKLAAHMGIEENERVISIFRLRYADEEPMVTIQNYLPWKYCDFVMGHDFARESLYEIMTQNEKSRPEETKTIVSAHRATAEDIKLLKIKKEDPILCSHTISRNAEGVVVDYAYSHYRSDCNKFILDAKPESKYLREE